MNSRVDGPPISTKRARPQHPFDKALRLQPHAPGIWKASTSKDYANFVGPFGGMTAAQAVQAVLTHPMRQGEPVAFTFNFAAVIQDGDFLIQCTPSRTNRSTQHWLIQVLQGQSVLGTGTAITAIRRATWQKDEVEPPDVPAPQKVQAAEYSGLNWLHQYELRVVRGGMPESWEGQGAADSQSVLWMRDAPARSLDHVGLAAYADVFFPRIWMLRATHVPLGTVTMSVYFHAPASRLTRVGTGYVLGSARGSGFGSGFFDQTAHLWSQDKELLATTHQLVYFKK